MIETPTTQPNLRRRQFDQRDRRRSGSVPFSVSGPIFGVIFVLLALIWVMNIESMLPSIRVGERSGATGVAQTLDPGTVSADNPAINRTGNWFQQTLGTNQSSSVTLLEVTTSPGNTMTFRFYGTDLSVLARIGPESGKAYVAIDGDDSSVLPADSKGSYVDLSGEQAEDQSILIASGLAHRDHVVTITSQGTDQLAIGGFTISANSPFPWAFVFLYVALAAALFVLVRLSIIGVCRQLGWMT